MWNVIFTDDALNDFRKLSGNEKNEVSKAIKKFSQNPLPKSEGGYGNPLGNKGNRNLTNYYKIKLLKAGIRIIYKLVKTEQGMIIIVIGARSDDEVYDIASKRIKK